MRDDTPRDDTMRDDTVRDDTARDDTVRDDTVRDDVAPVLAAAPWFAVGYRWRSGLPSSIGGPTSRGQLCSWG
uniref:Uncharacterized protein n=1 Tax=Schlesneria paludicola TaxID=360056 RepID=A0A7C4QR85_9PLAN